VLATAARALHEADAAANSDDRSRGRALLARVAAEGCWAPSSFQIALVGYAYRA